MSKILDLYKNYGKLEKLQLDEKSNEIVYGFELDLKKFCSDEDVLAEASTLNLVIVERETKGITLMIAFGLADTKLLGERTYDILNCVNSDMVYGKFTVDKDKDIDWSHTYETEFATEENIGEYLKSLVKGIADMAIVFLKFNSEVEMDVK